MLQIVAHVVTFRNGILLRIVGSAGWVVVSAVGGGPNGAASRRGNRVMAPALSLDATDLEQKSRMAMEPTPYVPHNALVLVGDGQKALFLRNRGNAQRVQLVVEKILERDNPPTREQGTDRPGRSSASVGVARSAMEETDWHHIAEERFAGELAEALYRHAHANLFEKLVIIAPPKVLGNLRKALHAEVAERVAAEIPKELTSHPVAEIERLLAA
jgi:protein required for attachment to host cells